MSFSQNTPSGAVLSAAYQSNANQVISNPDVEGGWNAAKYVSNAVGGASRRKSGVYKRQSKKSYGKQQTKKMTYMGGKRQRKAKRTRCKRSNHSI